nr:pyruvate kinase [Tanacetum cinerariifolium]
MDMPDDVVFRIHYNGVFKYAPRRYEQFRVVEMQACTTHRVMFSHLLDMLEHDGYMSVEELVAWAEDEANSPYLRSPPLKSRPFRNDMRVLMCFDLENEDMNNAAKILEGMSDAVEGRIECVEGVNDVANEVVHGTIECVEGLNDGANCLSIDEQVFATQNKLDKGKYPITNDDIVTSKKRKNPSRGNGISIRENDNHVFMDNETNSDENVDNYSETESEESDKSFDYLSNGEDEVIELTIRMIQFKNTTDEVADEEEATEVKHDTIADVDKNEDVDDHGLGLTLLIRKHENYMEALLRKLKGNEMGITYPFALVEKPKEMYPVNND